MKQNQSAELKYDIGKLFILCFLPLSINDVFLLLVVVVIHRQMYPLLLKC